MIVRVCKKCGCTEFVIMKSGPHTGLYCKDNQHWQQKWLTKSQIEFYKNRGVKVIEKKR